MIALTFHPLLAAAGYSLVPLLGGGGVFGVPAVSFYENFESQFKICAGIRASSITRLKPEPSKVVESSPFQEFLVLNVKSGRRRRLPSAVLPHHRTYGPRIRRFR